MSRVHHCIVALLALGPTPAAAQCRAADAMSVSMVSRWRGLMVATDSSVLAALRRNFVAPVDSSTVVLVTDRDTCAKAMAAYNSVAGTGAQPPSGAVYVVKVGAVYIVRDPVQRS